MASIVTSTASVSSYDRYIPKPREGFSYSTVADHFSGQYVSPIINTEPKSRPVPPFETLYFLVDVSGSTRNLHGARGMRGVRGSTVPDATDTGATESDSVTVPKTKIIILAEIEAVATTISMFADQYDLSRVAIKIDSFGEYIHSCVSGVFGSNAILQELLYNLDKHIICDFGSTALLPAIRKVFKNCNETTVLVVATDGHPNSGGNAEETCQELKPVLNDQNCSVKWFLTIGAGSIKDTQHTFSNGRASRIFSRKEHDDEFQTVVLSSRPATGVNNMRSECNNLFLMKLASFAEKGTYCCACTDYSELKTTLSEFFAGLTIHKYRTVLDGGAFGDFDDTVTENLNFPEVLAVIINTSRGYYLVARDRQISLIGLANSSLSESVNSLIVIKNTENVDSVITMLLDSFDCVYNRCSVGLSINTVNGVFEVNCDDRGFPRMRRVEYV